MDIYRQLQLKTIKKKKKTFLLFQMPFTVSFLLTLDKSIILYQSKCYGRFIDFRRSLMGLLSLYYKGRSFSHKLISNFNKTKSTPLLAKN